MKVPGLVQFGLCSIHNERGLLGSKLAQVVIDV